MNFAYGKEFRYSEAMVTSKGVRGYVAAKAIAGGIKAMMVTGITSVGRKFLGLFLPAQGEGPNVDPQDPGFYHMLNRLFAWPLISLT